MAQPDPTTTRTRPHRLAARLRRAPWFGLSAGIHAALIAALVVLVPGERTTRGENKVDVVPRPAEPVVDLPRELPATQPEAVAGEVVVSESEVVEPAEPALEPPDVVAAPGQSAFEPEQWSVAIGLGASTGGRYVNRAGSGKRNTAAKSYPEAIDAGLEWLKNHQDETGRWDCDDFMKHDDPGSEGCTGAGNGAHDVGVTGLALLAFLGDGSTIRSGPYKDVVKKGVRWLKDNQDPDTGLFGTAAAHDFVYDHAIAAYAMCEAYGLSRSPLLKDSAQKGLDYLERHRNPNAVWRYEARGNDNDTSVTGWCIMAYESGRFFGLHVEPAALQCCAKWLDDVSDDSGLHGYRTRGEPSSRKPGTHQTTFPPDRGAAMTAVGLFCRFFMDQDPREQPVMKAAADLILTKPPVWDTKAGTIDHYYWYYATYALFQMGGRHWEEWRKKLDAAVIKTQHRDKAKKNLYGSWDPACAWGDDGGRVYSTAMLTLTLEAYYRYTRLVR